jgi:hypothetical protein
MPCAFVVHATGCRRLAMLNVFLRESNKTHKFCNICASKCSCGNCSSLWLENLFSSNKLEMVVLPFCVKRWAVRKHLCACTDKSYAVTVKRSIKETDWSPHEIFSNFIMFGAFVDGWHSVSDDPVFSYNEKYRTDWICRWLICPLNKLLSWPMALYPLQFFSVRSLSRLFQEDLKFF